MVYLRVGPFGVFVLLALVAVVLLFAGVGSAPVPPLDGRPAPGEPVLRGPSQVMTVPSEGEIFYEVKAGETLWQISARFGVGADEIANLNNIGESSVLAVGQKLRLPVARSNDPNPEASRPGASAGAVSGFVWPLRGRITSGFGLRWGRQHTGIDIAGASGAPVRASKAGVVTVAGWMGGYGKAVVLQHDDGTATLYGHNSKILVAKGQAVKQGERIAAVGSTGKSTGPHLHFEIIIGKRPVDPMPYLNPN